MTRAKFEELTADLVQATIEPTRKAMSDAGLSASADEALKQIEDKHYDTDMKDRGIKEIIKYGIAFAGKNVEIAKG